MGDIIKFFTEDKPPKNVEMKYGEAMVEFYSHMEAMRAMIRDKTMLGRCMSGQRGEESECLGSWVETILFYLGGNLIFLLYLKYL